MANLVETSNWEAGIYQLEETDVVRGGDPTAGGTSNIQPQQLANRTSWLKDNLGGILRLQGIVSIPTNITLDSTHAGKLILLPYQLAIDLPDPASVPVGMVLLITSSDASGRQSTVSHVATGFKFFLAYNERVWLVNDGTNWQIVMDESNAVSVGEMIYAYKVIPNTLEAKGQLLNRSDYPRIWAFISSLTAGVTTDYTWLTNENYKGCFSQGDGASSFRMPDLRSMFIRGLDNGRGIDFGRTYANPGGYEADDFKKHSHKISASNSQGPGGSLASYYSSGGNATYDLHGAAAAADIFDSSSVGGQETRPKNVGLIALIKA